MTEALAGITARLDAMDEAIKIVRATASAMPTPGMVQASVDALGALVAEQRQSSKEAIDKSEKSVENRISEQGKRLDDLKSRLDTIEGAMSGIRSLIAIVGLVLGVLIAGSTLLRPDPVTVAPRANIVTVEP